MDEEVERDMDLAKMARQQLEDFNRGDLEATRAVLSPDYVYEETGTGQRVEGPDAAMETFQAWRTAMPDLVGELIRVVVDGSIAVMEIRWRATHTGAMPLPSGELPPSGRNIDALGTTWQTWRDGKLVAERNHLDMLTMLTQLGVLPS